MMGIDKLLAERAVQGDPVRVAMAGCGFMGRGLVNQIVNNVPGMTLAAIAARNPDNAFKALIDAGVGDAIAAEGALALKQAIRQGVTAVTEDFHAITQADGIDVVIDVTGAVEFGCQLALDCFAGGKHLVLMNAEVDATVGAELGRLADEAGVVLTGCDGDQAGVQMNLIRYVRSIGITPLVSGSIKGLHDPYRNPTTQEGFARRWGQDPWMVTSFADGTKMSVEQSIVANATGMSVHKRGMLGRNHGGHVDQLTHCYDIDELRSLGGAVDYVVHAKPSSGIYCLGAQDDPKQQHYLELYQLGTGPLYSFYTRYRLCHFEVPMTAARAALVGDATVRALRSRHVEAVTTAKIDLKAGTVLDRLGGYHYYGEAEKAHIARAERLLPIGAAEGCMLTRDVRRDATLSYDDVAVPPGRLVDQLLEAQRKLAVGVPPDSDGERLGRVMTHDTLPLRSPYARPTTYKREIRTA
jgi:predicted homoserine dehydrogenase-like protein